MGYWPLAGNYHSAILFTKMGGGVEKLFAMYCLWVNDADILCGLSGGNFAEAELLT